MKRHIQPVARAKRYSQNIGWHTFRRSVVPRRFTPSGPIPCPLIREERSDLWIALIRPTSRRSLLRLKSDRAEGGWCRLSVCLAASFISLPKISCEREVFTSDMQYKAGNIHCCGCGVATGQMAQRVARSRMLNSSNA